MQVRMPAGVRFTVVADDSGVRVALTLVLGHDTYVIPFDPEEAIELRNTLRAAINTTAGIEEALEEEMEPVAKC